MIFRENLILLTQNHLLFTMLFCILHSLHHIIQNIGICRFTMFFIVIKTMLILIILSVKHCKKVCNQNPFFVVRGCILAHNDAARLFLNDVVGIYVRCVSNFMLGSVGYRFRIRTPCPGFVFFRYLGCLKIVLSL
jgi:hypothetical protein